MEGTLPEDDADFQKTVAQIGGRERIYLVSEPLSDKDEQDESGAEIVHEFIRDMFPGSLAEGSLQARFLSAAAAAAAAPRSRGDSVGAKQPNGSDAALTVGLKDSQGAEEKEQLSTCNGSVQRSAARRASAHCSQRAIDSPVIVFLFRETYLSKIPNHVCLKEILKDVKARTWRASIARPALIGLISASEESADTRRCAQLLELLLRSVFHRHSAETVWVGTYVPSADASVLGIKRNACRVIRSSQTADNTRHRGNPIYWPFQCFSWPRRRGTRGQANNSASKERENRGSKEESIPLKTKPISVSPPVDEDAAAGDS